MSQTTRRTVSMKAATYERLQSFCKAHGLAMAGLVEGLIADYLDEAGVPSVDEQAAAKRERERKAKIEEEKWAATPFASGVRSFG